MPKPTNILGTELKLCGRKPLTGFFRDGFCNTCAEDLGEHTVCAIMTEEFLMYSYEQGNDLITPVPQFDFPGLKPGDQWCLCASRWLEAYAEGKAPDINPECTHVNALNLISLDKLIEKSR